jgi:hypothetical protein
MDLNEIFDSGPIKPVAKTVVAADGHTYHKSSSANATEAPTNQGTHDALDKKVAAQTEGLSQHELDFVMMCQMYYDIYGVLIPNEVAVKRYGISSDQYENTLLLEPVQKTLIANNIIADPDLAAESASLLARGDVLSPRELIVANTMLDLLDTRSDKKKLQDLGMSTQEFQRLMRKPAFHKYCSEKAESLLQVGQHEVALALMDKVRQGDLKAISYYNEYMGRFTPNPKSTTVVTGSQSTSDMQYIVTRLIEIIIDEVEDAATAARIGDRVKMLIGASRTANEIIASQEQEIHKPEVAPMRPPSDVIKAIQARAGTGS